MLTPSGFLVHHDGERLVRAEAPDMSYARAIERRAAEGTAPPSLDLRTTDFLGLAAATSTRAAAEAALRK